MPSVCEIVVKSPLLQDISRPPAMTSSPQALLLSPVNPESLKEALRRGKNAVLVLDCRATPDFLAGRIRSALNVALPALILRRLSAGKLSCSQVIRNLTPGSSETFEKLYTRVPIVLYDYSHISPPELTSTKLAKALLKEGCSVHILEGGFEVFQQSFPEWCESPSITELPMTLNAVESKTNSGTQSSSIDSCDSSLGRETPLDELCFPVEILPKLYLGNAQNSCDRDALNKHKIKYILNVTPNLPNVFEGTSSYKYMQIPIADHWSQNLASFFPDAIQFIDEARERGVGVLVHCLAGISRSVTITVAYLMYKKKLSLEDAYEYVRVKKGNIAPNFNFMGQLQDFQQQLNRDSSKCKCNDLKACRCHLLHFISPGSSTDSGIDFDRYS